MLTVRDKSEQPVHLFAGHVSTKQLAHTPISADTNANDELS